LGWKGAGSRTKQGSGNENLNDPWNPQAPHAVRKSSDWNSKLRVARGCIFSTDSSTFPPTQSAEKGEGHKGEMKSQMKEAKKPTRGRGGGGRGIGKGGDNCHRAVLGDNIQGVTKGAIQRLVRRGGVKRISGLVNDETCAVTKVFLEKVMRDALTSTEHARRKTVTGVDMVTALKRNGCNLYGFGRGH